MQPQTIYQMNSGEIIKKAGLKATPQRKMIYEIMTELRHSPIDDIVAYARQYNGDLTLSTVYRILDTFCQVGLLSKMNHPCGKNFYDITPSDHHHLFNGNEVIDYIDPELTTVIKKNLKGDLFTDLEVEKITMQITVNNKKS